MPLLARKVSWAFQKRSPGQLGVDGNLTVKKEKANLQLQEEVYVNFHQIMISSHSFSTCSSVKSQEFFTRI